jgi:hypothetical protein
MVFSALKMAYRRSNSVIFRFYSVTNRTETAFFSTTLKVEKAYLCDLKETRLERIPLRRKEVDEEASRTEVGEVEWTKEARGEEVEGEGVWEKTVFEVAVRVKKIITVELVVNLEEREKKRQEYQWREYFGLAKGATNFAD